MERKIVLLPLLAFLFASCSPHGFQEPLVTLQKEETQPTIKKVEQPYISRKVGDLAIVEGYVQSNDLKLSIDGKTAKTSVKGNVAVNVIGVGRVNVPVDVEGTIEEDPDFGAMGYMKPLNNDHLATQNMRMGAKITCLTANCADSFIDIYVYQNNYVYHHQVQAHKNEIPDFTKGNYPQHDEDSDTTSAPTKGSGKGTGGNAPSLEPSKDVPAKPEPKKPKKQYEDDGSQFEHSDGDADSNENGGFYVGQQERDVNVIFPDLTPQKESPKKDDNKQDPKSGGKKDDKQNAGQDTQKDPKQEPKQQPAKDDKKTDTKSDSENTGIVGTILRKLNQAVTSVVYDKRGNPKFTVGRLENATNLYSYEQKIPDIGFHFIYPKRETYYGTEDMLNALMNIGKFNKAKVNGYVTKVGDVSRQKGGSLGNHSSHQMGIDADISYYFDDVNKQKGLDDAVESSKVVRSFMEDEQWTLFKSLVEQNIVAFIFVDPVIKKDLCAFATRSGDFKSGDTTSVAFRTLRSLNTSAPGHDNHFHLRLKCSEGQPRCRQQPLPSGTSTGC
ncbi:MAG: penicillin-insensitive murein endopeptidase [Bdellovibrionales bacterium]|nr:penicillin-insensitive murein endopeptidase [Bdellovibrionales bacterium]